MKNATLKRVRTWVDALYNIVDMQTLVDAIDAGIFPKGEEFKNLLEELATR